MSDQARIYYGGNDEEPYIGRNALGETVYFVPAGYPDLVPLLQEQAQAFFWPTVHQLADMDDDVDAATVAEWRANNPPLK